MKGRKNVISPKNSCAFPQLDLIEVWNPRQAVNLTIHQTMLHFVRNSPKQSLMDEIENVPCEECEFEAFARDVVGVMTRHPEQLSVDGCRG